MLILYLKKNENLEEKNKYKNVFFITGLPRSRTAWMSVMLTNKDSICIHEPKKYYFFNYDINSEEKYLNFIKNIIDNYFNSGYKYVGISCTDIVVSNKFYRKYFPNSKIIFIDRNINDVIHSTFKFTNIKNTKKIIKKIYNYNKNNKYDYIIKFKDLNNSKKFKKLWNFIYNNEVIFDKYKYKELCNFTIKLIKPYWK